MLDSRSGFSSQKIAPRSLEEFHDGLVFERRRVCNVHYNLGAHQHLCQALAAESIHARRRRGGNHFMTFCLEALDQFGTNETGSANNDNFHFSLLTFVHRLLRQFFGARDVVEL